MELRTENSEEHSDSCQSCSVGSSVTHDGASSNDDPRSCRSFPTLGCSHCIDIPLRSISSSSKEIEANEINCEISDVERMRSAIHIKPCEHELISSEIFSTLTPCIDDAVIKPIDSRSLCDYGSIPYTLNRKISRRNLALFTSSWKNCRTVSKHFRPISMKEGIGPLKQCLSNKSYIFTKNCSTASRLSCNPQQSCFTNTPSSAKCRRWKSIPRTESPSHLADLGCRSYTSRCDATTPSPSPHNDSAIVSNKAYPLLSVHSLHRDSELSVDDNPVLRSDVRMPSMIKMTQFDASDITSSQNQKPKIENSLVNCTTSDVRLSLETDICEQSPDPQRLRNGEIPSSCRKLLLRKNGVGKFRGAGCRKLKRRRREYRRLKDMVPSLKAQSAVSKVTLIEEAVKYIEELHGALIERFRARGLPPTLAGTGLDGSEVGEGNIRDLVVQLLTKCNPGCLPPTRLENNRTKLKLPLSRPKIFDRRSW